MDKLPDVRGIIDRYHIYERILDRNYVKLAGAGTPCTFYRNQSITPIGNLPKDGIKCYCWSTPTGDPNQKAQPDRSHFLCMGTGYISIYQNNSEFAGIGGYQKYGYVEHTFSTVSGLTASSANIIIGGERNSSYSITGNSLSETLITNNLTLTRLKEVNYFLANDITDTITNNNRITYSYSLDNGTNWINLTMTDYTASKLANRIATFTLPINTEHIKFKITLQKRNTTSVSPKFNSIRFRYRNMFALKEIDPRFDVNIPSFLAAREQQSQEISQGQYGWSTKYPLNFWTMPDANVENADLIKFLQGTYADYIFETSQVRKYTYGPFTQITHKGFEGGLLRDENDLLGIVHYFI